MALGRGPVLVTGASGFIGRALVRRLVGAGYTTVCTARTPVDLSDAVSWVPGDLVDPGFVDRLVGEVRPAVVFHLASRVTGSRAIDVVLPTLAANLTASVNVLRAATGVGCDRIVLTGSGDEPQGGEEVPASPYAAAKWAVGGYARMFHALYGTPVTIARTFMVYGPDQPDTSKVVPHVATSLLRGEAPPVSSGRRRCDWVYVDDVVEALLALATVPACVGRTLDVGTGRLHTVRHVVETVSALVGGEVGPVFGAVPDRPLETEASADVAQTTRVCGWAPSTTLREGLQRTVTWYARAGVT